MHSSTNTTYSCDGCTVTAADLQRKVALEPHSCPVGPRFDDCVAISIRLKIGSSILLQWTKLM